MLLVGLTHAYDLLRSKVRFRTELTTSIVRLLAESFPSSGALMELNIYKARSGWLMLVPSCFLPSQEAEQRHGPLQPDGKGFVSDAHPPKDWAPFAAKIERQTYVLISAAEAQRLLASHTTSPTADESQRDAI